MIETLRDKIVTNGGEIAEFLYILGQREPKRISILDIPAIQVSNSGFIYNFKPPKIGELETSWIEPPNKSHIRHEATIIDIEFAREELGGETLRAALRSLAFQVADIINDKYDIKWNTVAFMHGPTIALTPEPKYYGHILSVDWYLRLATIDQLN